MKEEKKNIRGKTCIKILPPSIYQSCIAMTISFYKGKERWKLVRKYEVKMIASHKPLIGQRTTDNRPLLLLFCNTEPSVHNVHVPTPLPFGPIFGRICLDSSVDEFEDGTFHGIFSPKEETRRIRAKLRTKMEEARDSCWTVGEARRIYWCASRCGLGWNCSRRV